MIETEERVSNFIILRGVLCLWVAAVVLCHPAPKPFNLYLPAIAFLATYLAWRVLKVDPLANGWPSYALPATDLCLLTFVLFQAEQGNARGLALFYLTLFLSAFGDNFRKGLSIGLGVSILYLQHVVESGPQLSQAPLRLLPIPCFWVVAAITSDVAGTVYRRRQEARCLEEIRRLIEMRIGKSSQASQQINDLRAVARELAQRFSNLIEDLNAGVWEMDVPSMRLTFVSHQLEDILGFPIEKWLQETEFWVQHVHPEDREQVVERCRKAIGEGKDYSFRYRAINADGQTISLQDTVHVVRDESGKIHNLRGVIVDITDHQRLEEEFRQAQKMEAVGRLAGGVAHDFNNLLTIISGYAQLAHELAEPGGRVGPYIEEILKAGERASALVRRLLAFTRRQSLDPQILDLNSVVKGTEKMIRRLIGEDIDVITVLPSGLGAIRSDPAQLEQVLINLSVNARDAMPNGGKLILETENIEVQEDYADAHLNMTPGPYVQLAVSDTGSGMDAHTRAHLFEPFFTTKEKGKGTGLGLATVYGIIKQAGGNIWAYSELGKGTTFKILLPRVVASMRSPQPLTVRAAQRGGTETILLVEDEEGIRSLVRGILRARGYTVIEAGRPLEALEISEKFAGHIHLLFTDVVMPQMNGKEVAERITASRPDTKVLYMSGYADHAIAQHGILNPGAPFLQKPFSPETLSRKVREILDLTAPYQA